MRRHNIISALIRRLLRVRVPTKTPRMVDDKAKDCRWSEIPQFVVLGMLPLQLDVLTSAMTGRVGDTIQQGK
eukprot:3348391-Pyramimonas_sp.AAC.1